MTKQPTGSKPLPEPTSCPHENRTILGHGTNTQRDNTKISYSLWYCEDCQTNFSIQDNTGTIRYPPYKDDES